MHISLNKSELESVDELISYMEISNDSIVILALLPKDPQNVVLSMPTYLHPIPKKIRDQALNNSKIGSISIFDYVVSDEELSSYLQFGEASCCIHVFNFEKIVQRLLRHELKELNDNYDKILESDRPYNITLWFRDASLFEEIKNYAPKIWDQHYAMIEF
ncbi:MAG: hypothetical protein F6K53_20230 [Moorea sp. SIO4A1]|uniref:hypothetical protein n=1 Tax=Moorena sp. SIO4A1 TaxID=2607835 RepID=UPI00144E1DF7|nr:hypothetical protein [Moorena sp. SIO4A1]NEQ59600.1 hypothetical protein [Moorena sp. SIO4A1]